MKRFLIALALLSGCGASDRQGNGAAAEDDSQSAGNARAAGRAGLTGLYEGGSAARPNQLCMIDGQFGLVVWGPNMRNCAGSGEAVREGTNLRLTMAGDQACAVDAHMESGAVILPETVPTGCSYYCGAGARLGGASFTRKGNKVEDAMKAQDLVGERLCEGFSPAP